MIKHGKLTVSAMLSELLKQSVIDKTHIADADRVGLNSQAGHPIDLIARRQWIHATEIDVVIDAEWLSEWTAKAAGIPFSKISASAEMVTKVNGLIKLNFAEQYSIAPVERNSVEIQIATSEPFLLGTWREAVEKQFGTPVNVVMGTPSNVRSLIAITCGHRAAGNKMDAELVTSAPPVNLNAITVHKGTADFESGSAPHLVDWILREAMNRKASDIHIEPGKEQALVRIRIDGELRKILEINIATVAMIVNRFKILGKMDISEKRIPQDGRIKTAFAGESETELRMSTLPTVWGEKLVVRIFDPNIMVRTQQGLGFNERDFEIWNYISAQPHGLICVTGPTGSGKTTTLYAALQALWNPGRNFCTVEDPVEVVVPNFTQLQVNKNIGMDFPSAVRAMLRQDPDVIMIGEVRDPETAESAIQAALTGHLVLTTMHTNDSTSAITRMLDLNVPPYLIKATLLGVVAQRLVRKLCTRCRRSVNIEDSEWEFLTTPLRLPKPAHIYARGGCGRCDNSGYAGRSGIYEMLLVSAAVQRIITPATDLVSLRRAAIANGMVPLRVAGAQRVAEGVTDIDELVKVAPIEAVVQ